MWHSLHPLPCHFQTRFFLLLCCRHLPLGLAWLVLSSSSPAPAKSSNESCRRSLAAALAVYRGSLLQELLISHPSRCSAHLALCYCSQH